VWKSISGYFLFADKPGVISPPPRLPLHKVFWVRHAPARAVMR
jgi:hypothetical protein